MKRVEWLEAETVRALHDQLLAAFGGSTGVRDDGMLVSAMARPRAKAHYASPDLFDLAAAYAFGVIKNHPFVDGNKRTGFTIAVVFLESNGYAFGAPEAEALVETLGLAAGDRTEAAYAEWLRQNSRRQKSRPAP